MYLWNVIKAKLESNNPISKQKWEQKQNRSLRSFKSNSEYGKQTINGKSEYWRWHMQCI
jgi:hypothetical protein